MSPTARLLPRRTFRTFAMCALLIGLTSLLLATRSEAEERNARIVNGTPVSAATFATRWSSMAGLVTAGISDTRRGQFCGGTFIGARLVATAAHCVLDGSQIMSVTDNDVTRQYNTTRAMDPKYLHVVGGRRILSVRDGDRIPVQFIMIHPKFDPEDGSFDVALIQLTRAPKASAGVVPISPVPASEDSIWGNGLGHVANGVTGPWIAGWGYRSDPFDDFFFFGTGQHRPSQRPTRPNKHHVQHTHAAARPNRGSTARRRTMRTSLANGLEEAVIPIQSDAVCDSGGPGAGTGYGRDFEPASMFCAGTLDTHDANDGNLSNNGVDSCYGDSGGPMLASNGSALRLVGIVSFGLGCASREAYGVYTRVAAMRSFLALTPRQPIKLLARPTVSGPPVVGGVLRCRPGNWRHGGSLTRRFRWVYSYSYIETDGEFGYYFAEEAYERIPGSDGRAVYRIKPADRGHRIACLEIVADGSMVVAENSRLLRIPGRAPTPLEQEESTYYYDDE